MIHPESTLGLSPGPGNGHVNRVLAFLCAHPGVRCAPSNWGGGSTEKWGGHSKKFSGAKPLHFKLLPAPLLHTLFGEDRCT